MEKLNPINLKNCEEMFLGCYKNLKPSDASKIEEWKDVPQSIKEKAMKGFSVENVGLYGVGDNLLGTLNWIKKIGIFKENK